MYFAASTSLRVLHRSVTCQSMLPFCAKLDASYLPARNAFFSMRCASARSKSFLRKRPVVSRPGVGFIPNRSLDFGEIARLCHAACFWPSRRRSGLRRGVARNRMRTEAGKMPESLVFPIRNGLGVSNDRFGFMELGS